MKTFLPIALLALAPVAAAQGSTEAEHLEIMRTAYRFAEWTQGAPRAGVDLRTFERTGYTGGAVRFGEGPLERDYAHADGESAFLVELVVAASVEDAHEQLLSWVASSSSPELVPRARQRHLALGDVGFLAASGKGSERLAWATFVRGNVAVRVLDVDRTSAEGPNLRAIAIGLDRTILASAVLEPGVELARPEVARLSRDASAVAAGDVVRLDVEVVDSADGTPSLAFQVGGSGLGYVEQHDDGAFYLHTTGEGPMTVVLDVLGSNGTVTRATLPVEVAPER